MCVFRNLQRVLGLLLGVLLVLAVPAAAEPLDLSSVSSTGSPEPIRTGFYAETALGSFMTLGGADGYSNMEAFLSLGVGYDFVREFSVGLQFQLAPSAGDCYGPSDSYCGASAQGSATFTMAAIDTIVTYRLPISERLFIPFRLFGGVANLSPLPRNDLGAAAGAGGIWVPTGGLATGVEYATRFDHFTVGIEASGRFVPALNMTALAFYPRIRYTF